MLKTDLIYFVATIIINGKWQGYKSIFRNKFIKDLDFFMVIFLNLRNSLLD